MKCTRQVVALLFAFALAVTSADEPKTSPEAAPEAVPEPSPKAIPEAVTFKPTTIKAPFLEQFAAGWDRRWGRSNATKGEKSGEEEFRYNGEWAVEEPTAYPSISGDSGLVVKTVAAHHAISASFDEPLDNTGKTLVVQYEVKLQNELECGGAYLKLLTESDKGIHAKEFTDKTPYTIMFGPDRCGSTNKVHFIFRHKNPKTGEYEEKHLDNSPSAKITKLSTLYTLIVRPDNSFDVKVNNESMRTGSLLSDFTPPVNPPKEIDDANDTKPADWVDDPKIPDPDAKKPEDWDEDAPLEIPDEEAEKPADWLDDEPLTVPDPDTKKPEAWDDDMDGDWTPPEVPNPKCEKAGCGEWKRPMKRNPAYKGKWYPSMIENPDYKGPWAPRKIPNPNYYEDATPSNFERMAAIGFELWTMQNNILFDNIYVGHSEDDAQTLADESWAVKYKIEKAAQDASKPDEDQSEDEVSFTEDPVKYMQIEIADFLERFFVSPLDGVKEKPLIAAFLSFVIVTFLGLFGVMFSLASAGKKPKAPHKKNDEPTPDDKPEDDASGTKDPGNDGDNEEEKSSASNSGTPKRRRTKKET